MSLVVEPQRRRRLAFAATLMAAALGVFFLLEAQRTFSGTFDESNHLASGLEWWQFGTYSMWTENPPLPRVASAAVPYLLGMRLPPQQSWDPRTHDWDRSWDVGQDLLYAGRGVEFNLACARLGSLPFFLLMLAATWGLAGGRRRPGAGLLAVALAASTPPLFAHGALATTDIAFVATFLLALLTVARWFEVPTRKRILALGAALALSLLCKFSTLVFFPIAVVAIVGARRLSHYPARPVRDGLALPWVTVVGHALLATAVAFVVTWACYRFSFGRIDDLPWGVKDWLRLVPEVSQRGMLGRWFLHARLPMPEFFHGLRFLAAHDAAGHEAYLLGKISEHGFWSFYLVALAVKTPLPTLIFLVCALPMLARRSPGRWPALAAALILSGILLVTIRSHINLGIRHVFVVLPLAMVAVAYVVDERIMGTLGRGRIVLTSLAGVLVAVQFATALAVRRTALGSFNALAGSDPAKVLLDSDLDWGQDLTLLRAEARARGIDTLKIAYFGVARLCQHDLPTLSPLVPGRPTSGWIAISENYYRNRSTFMLLRNPCDPKSTFREGEIPLGSFAWLEKHVPLTIVGSSIRLYHLP